MKTDIKLLPKTKSLIGSEWRGLIITNRFFWNGWEWLKISFSHVTNGKVWKVDTQSGAGWPKKPGVGLAHGLKEKWHKN